MTLDFDGEKYRLASDQQKTWGRTLIRELRLRGDERILDLGCGDGILTAELAQLVPEGFVLGIDASQSMVETARKDRAWANLRFELEDVNSIDFTCEFDVVFSNATLHWIRDHKKLLKNVLKSLKKRGVARFQFAADGNCSNLIRIVREVMTQRPYVLYFRDFEWPWYMPTLNEYRTLLAEVPFDRKKVWCENADKYFENAEAMARWIDQPSLVPFLAHVAGRDRQRFRNAVVERMIDQTRQDDGSCFEMFRRLNVFATK